MKKNSIILGSMLAALLAGCATSPVVIAPVGPDPARQMTMNRDGQLKVDSSLTWRSEGDNPPWRQHTGYVIYNEQGKVVKHVGNTVGYYAESARLVNLPPGKYVVKARAKDYMWVEVPVVIEPGRITKVHLNDTWHPATAARKTELVSLPSGNLVGWGAGLAN
jgi:hypothetical protein